MRIPLPLPTILTALLSAAPAAAQQSIAELKLSPADTRGRALMLQGEVVDVRALSPRSLQGVYRLLDGTDPIGVLVRTNDLPTSGGPFRIEARLSQEVLRDGMLLLDETGRREVRAWQWWSALALAGAGLLLAVAGTAWAGVVWRAEAGRPSFVLLEPVGTGAFVSTAPSTTQMVSDTPPDLAILPVPDSARRRRARRDSVTAPVTSPTPAITEASVPGAEPTPAPVTPAPVERPAPEPARPDPAALRRMAESQLEGAITRFVTAVVGNQPVTTATLYASSDTRRAKFLEFLTQYQPDAAMLGAEPSTIGESSAEAVFRLNFRWRGNFGVAQRKDARFIATARRAALYGAARLGLGNFVCAPRNSCPEGGGVLILLSESASLDLGSQWFSFEYSPLDQTYRPGLVLARVGLSLGR